MCAIVDANAAHEVFGGNPQSAGQKFFEWINKGGGRLIVGGKLLEELEASSGGFRDWASQAVRAGRMRIVDEMEVGTRTEEIRAMSKYRSNDIHILALAQVGGARLLYSNDAALQADFKNKGLIDDPRGKVYSTHERPQFRDTHKRLFANRNLCRSGE